MVFVDLALLFVSGLAMLVTRFRPAVDAGARGLAGLHRRRIAYFLGGADVADYDGRRALVYLSLWWSIGLLGGLVLLCALVVRVEVDGRGGADPAGGGLSGLARRMDALDGQLSVPALLVVRR